jgi:hypothetical protein
MSFYAVNIGKATAKTGIRPEMWTYEVGMIDDLANWFLT